MQETTRQEALLAWLKTQGVDTLDELVAKVATTLPPALAAKAVRELRPDTAVPVDEELLRRALMEERSPPSCRRVPLVPIEVEGVRYDPQDISRFDARPLYYYTSKETIAAGILRAFTSVRALSDHIRETAQSAGELGGASAPQVRHHVPGIPSQYFEHVNFGGNSRELAYRHALPNLTENNMSGWWFWAVSWNDQISSIKTGSEPITIFEHINFSGARWTIEAFTEVAWVGPWWNDRISSIIGGRL